jgi:hypothetical protein
MNISVVELNRGGGGKCKSFSSAGRDEFRGDWRELAYSAHRSGA